MDCRDDSEHAWLQDGHGDRELPRLTVGTAGWQWDRTTTGLLNESAMQSMDTQGDEQGIDYDRSGCKRARGRTRAAENGCKGCQMVESGHG